MTTAHDLRSEPDAGPPMLLARAAPLPCGTWRVPSDEELLPGAIEESVAALDASPGRRRDHERCDLTISTAASCDGDSQPFDLVRTWRIVLPELLRRYVRMGAWRPQASHAPVDADCGEFELWCRLALVGLIPYLPSVAAKYTQHHSQPRRSADAVRLARGRARVIERLAAEVGVFEGGPISSGRAVCTMVSFANHLLSLGARARRSPLPLRCRRTGRPARAAPPIRRLPST